jgi:hypothetical protein
LAPRVAEFDGGMINAVGLANPGVVEVRERHLPCMSRALPNARTIVNLIGFQTDEFRVVGQLRTRRSMVEPNSLPEHESRTRSSARISRARGRFHSRAVRSPTGRRGAPPTLPTLVVRHRRRGGRHR